QQVASIAAPADPLAQGFSGAADPPAVPAPPAQPIEPAAIEPEIEPPLTGEALNVAHQTELARLGCYGDSVDGKFGNRSFKALDDYRATYRKPGGRELGMELLGELRSQK